MVDYTFIPSHLVSSLEGDDLDKFLTLAQVMRKAYANKRVTGPETGDPFTMLDWRVVYVNEMYEVATTLGINDLPAPSHALAGDAQFSNFEATLSRVITRLKLLRPQPHREESVALAAVTKETLRAHLEALRNQVNKSNLSESMKQALHNRIDAVEAELEKRRAALSPFWILAGAISLLPPAVSTAADLPNALQTIQAVKDLVDNDKAAESNEEERMGTSVKSITHVPQKQITDQR